MTSAETTAATSGVDVGVDVEEEDVEGREDAAADVPVEDDVEDDVESCPQGCEDENPCTDDACVDGECRHTFNTRSCDDGDACTQGDVCREGVCGGGGEACCEDGLDNDGDGLGDCQDGDCAGGVACGGLCPELPAFVEARDAPLRVEVQPGRSESVQQGEFTDDYVFNSAGTIKVGVRREWGGSVVFFGLSGDGPGMNATNTIDANDTGREVQVAFYDPDRRMQGCSADASCVEEPTSCPNSITYLGWNPVQGGNRCNRGSGVESVTNEGGVLSIVTRPLFWNPNWERLDCVDAACEDPVLRDLASDVRVVQSIRFVRPHIAELEYTLINLSELDHRPTAQEMPTVYSAIGRVGPDLWRLFNSQGQEIAINEPANDGFFSRYFDSPGGWATLQNDDATYGVGLYTENRLTRFQGWQNRGLPFNNFRAEFIFGLAPFGVVRARAYLILGSQETVAAEAAWLSQSLPPFGALDAPVQGASVSGTMPVQGWAMDDVGVVAVRARLNGQDAGVLEYGGARPDVCAVWPQYASCGPVGYQGVVDVSGLEVGCSHLLEIVADDTHGNERVIARRLVERVP